MKRILILATVAFFAGATSCTDGGEAVLPPPVPETTVRLEGAIGSSTRAVIGSGYEKDLEVSFARSDETAVSAETYGAWSLCDAVRSGGTGNRPILFAESQLYPEDGGSIRLCGYYPRSTGVTDSGVTFGVDGDTDIMATGLLSGSHSSPIVSCLFRHLLTQLQFICYSDRAADWGSIVRIEAESVHTGQRLDLSEETPQLTDISTEEQIRDIRVGGIAGLSMPEIDEADPVLPEVQGYILLPVSPETGTETAPLRLRIVTTHDGKGNETETVHHASVFVEGGFQAGELHCIELLFSGRGLEVVSVSVADWNDHTTDGGNIDL
mgnify:FL=1